MVSFQVRSMECQILMDGPKNCPTSGFPHIFLSMLFRSVQFYCYLTATLRTSLVEEAPKQDVVILCLPPHTTAHSQPLDTSVFGPLKVHW